MSRKDEKLDKALELLWALVGAYERDQTAEELAYELGDIVRQAKELLAQQPTP